MDTPTIYCEQLSFSTQHLNILSNGFFVFFAILALLAIKKIYGYLQKRDYFLAALLGIVGLGSFTWHIMPTNWTDYADTLPIIIFTTVSLILIFKKIFPRSVVLQIVSIVSILLIGLGLERMPELNNSLPYVFILLLLILISLFFSKTNIEASTNFRIASIIFFFSLTARIFDLALCNYIPIGTHFLWHTLNAIMGYYIILGISSLYRSRVNL